MPAGELFINGQDAYTTWGVSFTSTALSALMTPPPLKEMIQNKSRLEHGKRVILQPLKLDERTLTLEMNISAQTEEAFLARYSAFCAILAGGIINISTKYQTGVEYHCLYLSCQSFGEYQRQLGRFSLRLVEPNPADREPIEEEEEVS